MWCVWWPGTHDRRRLFRPFHILSLRNVVQFDKMQFCSLNQTQIVFAHISDRPTKICLVIPNFLLKIWSVHWWTNFTNEPKSLLLVFIREVCLFGQVAECKCFAFTNLVNRIPNVFAVRIKDCSTYSCIGQWKRPNYRKWMSAQLNDDFIFTHRMWILWGVV